MHNPNSPNQYQNAAGSYPRRFVAFAALAFLVAWGLVGLISLYRQAVADQYLYLADAFMHGRLYIDNYPTGLADQVFYRGHSYVPFGPFPAVVAMPFVALFGLGVHTTVLTFPLSVLNGVLLWRIFAALGVARRVRGWLLALFFLGSVYTFVMISEGAWFLAQVVTVSLLLGAIWLALRRPLAQLAKGSWLAIGLLLGAAFLSRSTAIFAALFFVTYLLLTARRDGWPRMAYLGPLSLLAAGLGSALIIFALYNYLRFGSFTETGYAMAQLTSAQLREAMSHGLFSLHHLPMNFYYMFLAGFFPYPAATAMQFPYFVPSPLGTSILLTTPALLYTLRPRWHNPLVPACWAVIIPTVLALLCYYGTGQIQFGYRYTLDFMPFALILLALAFRDNFTRLVRILILIGICVCIWGNATIGLVWYD